MSFSKADLIWTSDFPLFLFMSVPCCSYTILDSFQNIYSTRALALKSYLFHRVQVIQGQWVLYYCIFLLTFYTHTHANTKNQAMEKKPQSKPVAINTSQNYYYLRPQFGFDAIINALFFKLFTQGNKILNTWNFNPALLTIKLNSSLTVQYFLECIIIIINKCIKR